MVGIRSNYCGRIVVRNIKRSDYGEYTTKRAKLALVHQHLLTAPIVCKESPRTRHPCAIISYYEENPFRSVLVHSSHVPLKIFLNARLHQMEPFDCATSCFRSFNTQSSAHITICSQRSQGVPTVTLHSTATLIKHTQNCHAVSRIYNASPGPRSFPVLFSNTYSKVDCRYPIIRLQR